MTESDNYQDMVLKIAAWGGKTPLVCATAAMSSIIALGGLVGGGGLSITRLFASPRCILTDLLEGGKGEGTMSKVVRVKEMEVTFGLTNGLSCCK